MGRKLIAAVLAAIMSISMVPESLFVYADTPNDVSFINMDGTLNGYTAQTPVQNTEGQTHGSDNMLISQVNTNGDNSQNVSQDVYDTQNAGNLLYTGNASDTTGYPVTVHLKETEGIDLTGWQFLIWNDADYSVLHTVGAGGQVILPAGASGTYFMRAETVPEGYTKNDTVYDFVVESGKTDVDVSISINGMTNVILDEIIGDGEGESTNLEASLAVGNNGIKEFSPDVAAIVAAHLYDFNYNTYKDFLNKNYGGDFGNYARSLGSVFSEFYGKTVVPKTDQDMQRLSEYVFGWLYMIGFDYLSWGGTYRKWGSAGGSTHSDDAFYPGTMKHNVFANGRENIDATISNTLPGYDRAMLTECGTTIDMIYWKAGLTDRNAMVKSNQVKYIGRVADLKVGDKINFFSTNVKKVPANAQDRWNNWKNGTHVAMVGEVYDDYIVIYDGGGYFINGKTFKRRVNKTGNDAKDNENVKRVFDGWYWTAERFFNLSNHVHSLTKVEAKAATCTEPGNIAYWVCNQGDNACGCCFSDASGMTEITQESTVIPAKNHSWGEWTVKKAATCTAKGLEEHICQNDATHKETRDIAIDANAHNWGNWQVTTPATEKAEGLETRVCKNDSSHKETRPIAVKKHTHVMKKVMAKSASCTKDGNIEYWICSEGENPCGKYFADEAGTKEITKELTVVKKTGHKWGEWSQTKPATCTTPGEETSVCQHDSSHKQTRETKLDANAHSWGEWTVTTESTEKKEGVETRVCKYNPDHKETRPVPVKAHKHVLTKVEATPATCTGAGNMEYWICSGGENPCGHCFADAKGKTEITKESTVIPAKNHAFGDWTVTKAATCSAEGVETRICANDSSHKETRPIAINEKAHRWSGWSMTKAATETEEGMEVRVCRNNQAHTETRKIPVKAHTHVLKKVAAKAETCTEPGNIEYWVCGDGENPCGRCFADAEGKKELAAEKTVIKATGHAYGEWTLTRKATCSVPGEETRVCMHDATHKEVRETLIDADAHNWGPWTVTKEATEKETGTETRVCQNDKKHTETRVIPVKKHKHGLTKVEAKPATCTENGNTEYWVCNKGDNACGHYFADADGKTEIELSATVIKAPGHDFGAWTKTKEATCSAPGEEQRVCRRDSTHKETRQIAIQEDAHNWGAWKVTKPATETEAGTEMRVCQNDQTHVETRTIPVKAHVHSLVQIEAKAATCTEDGNTAYWICSGGEHPCGRYFADAEGKTEIQREDTVIARKNHAFGEWTMTKKATCAEPGEEQRVCANDPSHKEVRVTVIDDTAHAWGPWTVVKEATETEEGVETRACKNDPAHIETRAIPVLTHVHKLVRVDAKAATCTEDGNILHWVCAGGDHPCGRYFADAEGKTEIQKENTVVKAKGHEFGDWILVTAPTCYAEGVEERTCKKDVTHKEARNVPVNPDAHAWGEWEVTKEATETEPGEETRTCKNDPTHIETRTIPATAHVHSLVMVEAREATCTEDGCIRHWVCSGSGSSCGRCFADAEGKKEIPAGEAVIPAFGHEYGDWSLVSAATCTTPGEEERVCLHDPAHKEHRATAIDENAHSWGPWSEIRVPTETVPGLEARVCANNPKHTQTRTIPALTHVHGLTKVEAVEATCQTDGHIAYWVCEGGEDACDRCFADAEGTVEIEREDTVIKATGHDYGAWITMRSATCSQTGEEMRICRNDPSHVETRETPIDENAHAWGKWKTAKKPTENEEGIEYRACKNHPEQTETRVIPATAHVHGMIKVMEKAAACEEEGNIAYWACGTGLNPCGHYFADEEGKHELQKEDVVIPATGHDFGEWVISKEATCSEKGEMERVCANDQSHKETKQTPVDPHAHAWGEWTVTKEATAAEEGTESRTCQHNQAHVETRSIPKTSDNTTYTLSYNANGGTEVASEKYPFGTIVTVKAVTTRSGYTFLGWYDRPEGGTRITAIRMNDNIALYAHWEAAMQTTPGTTVQGQTNVRTGTVQQAAQNAKGGTAVIQQPSGSTAVVQQKGSGTAVVQQNGQGMNNVQTADTTLPITSGASGILLAAAVLLKELKRKFSRR